MSSRFPGGHCNTGTGHTPVTGTHPTQLSPLDRACWTPVPVSTNHIAPGALNPISVPVATVTGWISSAQRTRLRAPSGVAPAIGSSPASFMLILDEPIRRVNTLTVMDFQTAGRVWPITPDRHTNMLCMAPCSSEPLPPCAPECPTAATCCCGTTADCTAHTTEPDCEGECDDCEWSDTTGKCGTAWTTLCAPPMANPTLPEVLGWLQRQTPLGWEWVISPDGHAGVRAVAISTGPYTTASCGQPPISSQSFVFPSSDLQICFGGDRPLNPSLGWILGFRDRCYRFPAPAAAATLHLSLGHYYTTEPTSMHTVTLRWKCIRASPLAGLSASTYYTLQPVTHLVGPAVYAITKADGTPTVVGHLVAQLSGPSGLWPPDVPGTYYWAVSPGDTPPTGAELANLQAGLTAGGGVLECLACVELPSPATVQPPHAPIPLYTIDSSSTIQFTVNATATAFGTPITVFETPEYTNSAGTTLSAPTSSANEALAWALPHLSDCSPCPTSTCGPTVYRNTEAPTPATCLSAQSVGNVVSSVSSKTLAAAAKPLLPEGASVEFARYNQTGPAQQCNATFTSSKTLVAIMRTPTSTTSTTSSTSSTGTSLNGADLGLTGAASSECPPTPVTPHYVPCPAHYAEGVFSPWGERPPFTLCIDDYQSRGAPGQSSNSSLSGGGTTPANAIGTLATTGGAVTITESPVRTYAGLTTISRLGISIVGPDGRPVDLIDDFAIQLQFTSAYDPA